VITQGGEAMGKNDKAEVRAFTINGREHWFRRDQIKKEFGCKTEKEAERIWKDGKKAEKTKTEPKKETLEDKVLKVMKTLKQNGITEFTSTQLRDKLSLDKATGRGKIRRAMKRLEKDGKVLISQKSNTGKRKQYVYKLKK
jgi:hypothetical protein